MRAVPPSPSEDPFALSENAKIILRHFRDTDSPIDGYELPARLAELVPDLATREYAITELSSHGLVTMAHFPPGVPRGIHSCALTYEGKKFIEDGELDD